MGKLLFGTSSWSEKSWSGVFYPESIAPGEMLAYYSTQFSTVEADVTYYRIPERKMVQNWYDRTTSEFIMSAKFPRSIVHGGADKNPDPEVVLNASRVWPEVEKFLDAMSILKEKCGPLIIQLPYYNKKVFASEKAFYDRLFEFTNRLPNRFRFGVEIRNRQWFTEEFVGLLKLNKLTLVLADLPFMPHPLDLIDRVDLVPVDYCYIRLIGDRHAVEEKTQTFDKIVIDQTEKLKRWAAFIHRIQSKSELIFTYANNHFAGFGPGTIRQLIEIMDQPADNSN
jgi:uncharacterized protein YecE (DUF72 family)